MVKMKAPEGCPGIQFRLTWFPADASGIVVLPDEYERTAEQHGFTAIREEPGQMEGNSVEESHE